MIASLSEAAEEHKKYTGLSTEIKKAFDHVGKTSADFCGAVNLTIEQVHTNEIYPLATKLIKKFRIKSILLKLSCRTSRMRMHLSSLTRRITL